MRRLQRAAGRALAAAAVVVLVLCAALTAGWFVTSGVTGAQLVVFKTGSMSPTMPRGTLAVGLPRPASELAVGDVVTVPNANGSLPVTHRITGIAPDPSDPAMRLLTMRGDGNPVVDARPYRVSQGLVIIAAAPGLGGVVDLARAPVALAAGSLIAAAAMLWALWPAAGPPAPRRAVA